MKVGYLGPKNSFTYQASSHLFKSEEKVPFTTIPLVIKALEEGKVEAAVVPIENSLEGSVHASMDTLFHSRTIQIEKELILPIRQQFMMYKGQDTPKKIMSHPQALAQSQEFLLTNYPTVPIVSTPSTTYAAEYVSLHPEEKIAAIASVQAAEAFDLSLVHKDIQDNEQNQTRFWMISTKNGDSLKLLEEPLVKMTLFCTLPSNKSGALHQLLSAFSWREIDLVKIESRPLKTSLGQYYFIIDLELKNNLTLLQYAVEEIKLLGIETKSMGPYSVIFANES